MKKDDEVRLLEELANILKKQIGLALHGDFAGLERLAGQCEPFVARIAAAGLLENRVYGPAGAIDKILSGSAGGCFDAKGRDRRTAKVDAQA
jgi:hypothetical protein